MDEVKSFGEKVRENVMVSNKTITVSFPSDVYNEFKHFAKESAGDCYWLAIKDLLNQSKYYSFLSETTQVLIQNNNMLMSKILEMDERLGKLEVQGVAKPSIKHFGKSEEKKE